MQARTGQPTLEIDGRVVHSVYDPVKEARREIEPFVGQDVAMLVILGMGLGYAIDAALELLPCTRVLVIEADEAIYRAARAARPLPASPRLTYVVGRNAEANFIAITTVFDVLASTSFRYLTRLAELDPEYYAGVVNTIGRAAEMHIEGLRSTASFGLLWWENAVRNYREYATLPDVGDWFGAYRNQPLFVFAAGPTLEDDLDRFAVSEGGIRFVVDTAYERVRSAGVRIDAVFAVDAQDRTLDHFALAPPERLIAVPVIPPRLFTLAREKMINSLIGPLFDWFDQALTRPVARLKSGGSVTTFAFDLARRMGAGPIIFVGADFAHRDGRRHAPGTAYERLSGAALNRFASIEDLTRRQVEEVAVLEGGMRTENNLVQYARWLEWEIRETRSEVLRLADFGLLREVPVIEKKRLAAVLDGPRPEMKWPAPRREDPRRLFECMRAERVALDEALKGDPRALTALSSFYDPIVRPAAVASQRGALEPDALDRLYRQLTHARAVLDEVLGAAARSRAE